MLGVLALIFVYAVVAGAPVRCADFQASFFFSGIPFQKGGAFEDPSLKCCMIRFNTPDSKQLLNIAVAERKSFFEVNSM